MRGGIWVDHLGEHSLVPSVSNSSKKRDSLVYFLTSVSHLQYSEKLSREKTFTHSLVHGAVTNFHRENFSKLLTGITAKRHHTPQFRGKTFADSYKTLKFVEFSPTKVSSDISSMQIPK